MSDLMFEDTIRVSIGFTVSGNKMTQDDYRRHLDEVKAYNIWTNEDLHLRGPRRCRVTVEQLDGTYLSIYGSSWEELFRKTPWTWLKSHT